MTIGSRRRWQVAGVLAPAVFLAFCASQPVQGPGAPGQATAASADVRLTTTSAPVAVRVGQTVGLQPPGPGEWQVDYDPDRLRLVTARERLQSPGETGWVWEATAIGEASIVITSRPQCAAPPCPPNASQFSFTLEIGPRA